MHIDSRYPIGNSYLLAGAESVPEITLTRVSGYRRSPQGRDNAPFIRSITHAPDQTLTRPRLFHDLFNLAAPSHYELWLDLDQACATRSEVRQYRNSRNESVL